MCITDVKQLRGRPWVRSERAPGHPVRLLSRRLLPIVVLVRCCSVQDAGSYTWPERVLLLNSVTTMVPIVDDSRRTSLRVHLGSLLASGPALALVLHLPVKYGSRTPGLEFRCRIVSREEGCCVSWVPLGVERVACMTAAYLKTLASICLTKLFW